MSNLSCVLLSSYHIYIVSVIERWVVDWILYPDAALLFRRNALVSCRICSPLPFGPFGYDPSLQKGRECSALPCMIVSRTCIIPIWPRWEHQKQPPKRPLMNTLLQESTDPWTLPAFLTMWTVSNTANNRTGRRSRMRSIFGHRSSCKKFTINYSW